LPVPTGGTTPGVVGVLGGPGYAYRSPQGRLFTVSTDANGNVASFAPYGSQTTGAALDSQLLNQPVASAVQV